MLNPSEELQRKSAVYDEAMLRNAGVSWDDATQGMVQPDERLGSNFAMKRLADIVFSVKRKVWRQDDEHMESANAEYQRRRPNILVKGMHKCIFCGYRSKSTEVHHLNDNHADNSDANLVIACPLCHGTQHIGQVGSKKQGVIINIEGIPQSEFNHLQRTIAIVLEIGTEEEKADARALVQHLASRSELVSDQWGSANPSDFGNALLTLRQEDFDKREGAFAGLALLYKPVRFFEYVGRWIEENYKSLPINTWRTIYERAVSAK